MIATTPSERAAASEGHAYGMITLLFPIGGLAGAAVTYVRRRDVSPFVREHARAALNAQVTAQPVLIAAGLAGFSWFWLTFTPMFASALGQVSPFALLSRLGIPLATILGAIFALQAAVAAFAFSGFRAARRGDAYRYPFAYPFFREPAKDAPALVPVPDGVARNWGLGVHLAAAIDTVVPFGGLVAAIVAFATKGRESPYLRENARCALNAQATFVVLYYVLTFGVQYALRGAGVSSDPRTFFTSPMLPAEFASVMIAALMMWANVGFGVYGAYRAYYGLPYRYPYAIPFVR